LPKISVIDFIEEATEIVFSDVDPVLLRPFIENVFDRVMRSFVFAICISICAESRDILLQQRLES